MGKEAKTVKNYKKKHMAGDLVARRQISKYKQKDRKKAEKKQRIEQKEEADRQVSLVRQKQVDDFVSQAKSSKGKEYQKMSVDDFLSYGFAEDSDDDNQAEKPSPKSTQSKKAAPTGIKKMAVPVPSRIVPIKSGKKIIHVPLDDEEDSADHMDFSDEEIESDEAFYKDKIEAEDENKYDDLEVDGVEADDEDFEFDEDDLYGDDDEDEEAALGGGYFDAQMDDEDDDEDGEYDAATHEEQLKQLKTQDPELYKYLLQNDPSMLQFEQDDESDESEPETVQSKGKAALTIENLTSEQFQKIKGKFDRRKYNAKDLLLVIRLFKSAVMVRKKANVMQARAKKQGRNLSQKQSDKIDTRLITLTSSPLYLHLVQFSLRVIPCALVELLYLNNNTPIPYLQEASPHEPLGRSPDQGVSWRELAIALSDGISPFQGKFTQLAGWTKVATLTRTYFLTVFALLRDAVDSGLIRLILRSILPAIPLLESVTIPTQLLLRRVLHFWCYSPDVSYTAKDTTKTATTSFRTDHTSRIEAFLVLRRLSMCLPFSSHIKEAVMKGVYQYFAKVAKHVTSYSVPTITFLTNCIVELYGIDGVLAYQLTYVYLRQLATQLRAHLVTPTSKGLRAIYNWQFINCLRVWGQVLSTYAIEPNSALRPLIYPFAQISTTLLSLSSAPAFFPVKLVLCELLTELMYKTQVFIPTATNVLNILRHPSFCKKKHSTITKHHAHLQKELTYKLHIAEGLLDSLQYKENIATRAMDILARHLSVLADAVFFPEYSYPIRTTIKQLLSMVQIPSVVKDLRALQTAIGETSHYVLERRAKTAFSPRDVITKQVNPMTLMANTVALNALHNAAGGSGVVGQYKPTSLHKLNDKRVAARELEKSDEIKQQMMNDLGEPDSDSDDDDDDDDDDGDDDDGFDEESEAISQKMKRKSLADRDDYDDEDEDDFGDDEEDVDDMFDDEDDEGEDLVGDFDMLDDDSD